jgi:hypothetical protein
MPIPFIVWAAAAVGAGVILSRKKTTVEPAADLTGDRGTLTPGMDSFTDGIADVRTFPVDRGPGASGRAERVNPMPQIRGFDTKMPEVTRARPPDKAVPEILIASGTPTVPSRVHPAVERCILSIREHSDPLLITDAGVSTDKNQSIVRMTDRDVDRLFSYVEPE